MGKRVRKVLVIDDEIFLLNMVHDMLDVMGYGCDGATVGEDGVEKYKNAMDSGELYCAVIVDLTLSNGMSGTEVAAKIKEIDTDASLIVSSGFADEDVMAKYEKFGFSAALPKPYTMDALKEDVDSICGRAVSCAS